MELRINIIGIGADGPAGLAPELIGRINGAEFLAGGNRHLSYFPEARGERYTIGDNLAALQEELAQRHPAQRCVVLASGDPLFYGIGSYLVGVMGSDRVSVQPALSSMQLAFARAGIAWQTAALASIHGRDLRGTLLPLLGRPVIGLFSQDGESPARVARFFLRYGLNDYRAVVGENLGGPAERVSRHDDMRQLADRCFAPLNYLILERSAYPIPWPEVERCRGLVPGVPDEVFARPEDGPEVMTRQEVRSVVLGKLFAAAQPGDVLWDIGAGLGTVSVEAAVLRPQMEVLAIEGDPARVAFLRQNRERFDAWNVRVIEGFAPEALAGEAEPPRLVFLGGSGGRLPGILDLVRGRLREGGRFVANFVTLEHLAQTLDRLRAWGWPFEVTELHVSRSDQLAGLTGLKPQRGVFLVRADKPGASNA